MTKHSIKLDLVRLRGKARREEHIVDVMLGKTKPAAPPLPGEARLRRPC
jgi:hypothetical protein